MKKTLIKTWNKVLQTDLDTISFELKKNIDTPALILLKGDLGAGKTTFAKTFSKETHSPTYSVLIESEDVLHGDFYRIKEAEEIIHLELPLYLEDKNYFTHSGYFGSTKTHKMSDMLVNNPEKLYKLATRGMLPKTKLGNAMLKKLKVYAGEEHPHTAQIKG